MAFRIVLEADIESVWPTIDSIGGEQGYYGNRMLWLVRGAVDCSLGGPGLKNKRHDTKILNVNDQFHFWRVSQIDRPHRLVIESRMKAFGNALMVFHLSPESVHTQILLQSVFAPR